jgi:RND family efflux transporter MFP subunit
MKAFLILLGSIALAVLFVLMRKEPEKIVKPESIATVEICTAEAKDETIQIYTQGTVEPRTSSTLVSQVSGEILSVSPSFYTGGFFRKGDVLLEIDPIDYEVALTTAESTLAQARLSYMQEQAQSDQARKDWENMGMEGEPSELTLRVPQLKHAEAAVKSAEASLKQARKNLSNTKVIAPYNGIMTSKNVDLGQYVTTGNSLGSINAVDAAEVRLSVKESDLKYLNLPEKLNVSFDGSSSVELSGSYSGKNLAREATLVRTEGTIDSTSRLIYLVARLEDPYSLNCEQPVVPFGMFVSATIEGKAYTNVVKLPRYALRGMDTILVVDKDNRIDIRKVDVLKTDADYVYVADGIGDGERVCLTALEYVVQGLKVADINSMSKRVEASSSADSEAAEKEEQ